MAGSAVNSLNPVFANFRLVDKNDTIGFKANAEVVTPTPQEGAAILEAVMVPGGAKMGFNNEGNVPFHDPCEDIPWGDAILCLAEKDSNGAIETLTQLDANHIHGTCYGATIKDSSVQLNAGISVSGETAGVQVPVGDDAAFVVALRSNVQLDESTGRLVPIGKAMSDDTPAAPQVLAISEAIDPTVIQLGKTGADPNVLTFNIPKATGGFTFTVRGTVAKAPFVNHVSNYTSMKDKVTSFPTSQAIIDAKA